MIEKKSLVFLPYPEREKAKKEIKKKKKSNPVRLTIWNSCKGHLRIIGVPLLLRILFPSNISSSSTEVYKAKERNQLY